MWGFCECGSDLHRSVKDASYTVTRPGTVSYSVRHDILTQVLMKTGEGSRAFRWNIVPSSGAVRPEDGGKVTGRQGETPQMTCIFTNTAVRISPSPSVFPKRWQETTILRKIPPKSAYLIYTVFKACNHTTVEVLCCLLSACQENAQTEVGWVFSLLRCSRVCWPFQI
jgi:hypothetical protein